MEYNADTPLEYQRCVQLLADDPVRETRRQELENRRLALLGGQECLKKLADKYTGPSNATRTTAQGAETESMLHGNGDDEMADEI